MDWLTSVVMCEEPLNGLLWLLEKDRILAEVNVDKEAWQTERESVHQLELQAMQMELEMEREKHFAAVRELEQKHGEVLADARKSLEQSHETEVVELERQWRSDVAEVRAELERKLASRETELTDELHSVASDAAHLRSEVSDLTLSKSKAAAENERHIDALKQQLDLMCKQHEREMSEVTSEHRHEIEALEADLEFLRSDRGKMNAELVESLSRQGELNSLCAKFHGEVSHLAGWVVRLRGEVLDALKRSAVDLRNDVTVVEREMQQLKKLHSLSLSKLSGQYDEEIAYWKDLLHTVQQEREQMVTDHEAEMSRLRLQIEESLTTQHHSAVADLATRHSTEVNQLQREIDRHREKCDVLSTEVARYQQELKQRGDEIELLKESHRAELWALNEQREELSELQQQKNHELMQSVSSLEAKHADEVSMAEASHKARIDSLMEEVEKLHLDSEQSLAVIREEKQKEIETLRDVVASLQKQNETLSPELEFKAEQIAHLHDQLNILGHEHSQAVQEIECSKQQLEDWKQLAGKLEAENATLVQKNTELSESIGVQVETLQSEKDRMLEERASKHEQEIAQLQTEIDAATKASEEVDRLKDTLKSVEEQLAEATSGHLHEMEQLQQQHHEEKVALEEHASSLRENLHELKSALAEKESCIQDLNQMNETNTLLHSEIAHLRELLERLNIKSQEEASEKVKLQMAKEAADVKLSEVENQLQEITNEREQLVNRCGLLETHIKELQSASGDIEQQLLEWDEEKLAVDGQVGKQVSQRVQDLIEEKKRLLSQNSDLDERNSLLQNQLSDLNQEHESMINELELVKLQMTTVRQDSESVAAELQQAKAQCTALVGELDRSRKLLWESEEHVQSRMEQEVALSARILTLEDEKSTLAMQLEEAKRLCDSVRGDLKAAKEEESLMNFSVQDLTEQLRECTSEMDSVCSELEASKEQCALFESQLEAKKEDTRQLEASLESVKCNCELLESELEKSREESEQLKMQVEDLTQDSASLETKVLALTDQLSAVEQGKQNVIERENFVEQQKNSVELHLNESKELVSSSQSQLLLAKEVGRPLQEQVASATTEEIESFRGQLQELRGVIKVLEDDKHHLETQLKSALAERGAVAERLRELETGNASLNNLLRDSRELCSALTLSCDEYQHQVSQLTASNEETTCELNDWQDRSRLLSEQAESLHRQLLQAEELEERFRLQAARLQEVEGQNQTWQSRHSELEQSNNQLSNQLQALIEKTDALKGTNDLLADKLESEKSKKHCLEAEIVEKVEQLESFNHEINEQKQSNDLLNYQLQALNEKIDALKETNDSLAHELGNEKSKNCCLEAKIVENTGEFESFNHQIFELKQFNNQLNYQLQTATEMADILKRTNASLSDELGNEKSKNHSLEARIVETTEQLESLSRQTFELKQSNNQLNNQLQDIIKMSEALKQTNDSLTDELEKEKSKKHSLEAEIVKNSEQLESVKHHVCELDKSRKQSQSQLENLQEENATLKVHATAASETVERLELHVSEIAREKESLGTQLETVLERQKVLQEQDSIAQAELRILRQRLSDLSKAQDVVDATTEDREIQCELNPVEEQLASQEQDSDTKEELHSLQDQGHEMPGLQNVTEWQGLGEEEKLRVLESRLAEARSNPSERRDGANFVEEAQFLLNHSKLLQEKVASLQELCDKQKDELEVTRKKIAWLRKSRQVTFADEVKQSESGTADAVDENTEEGRKLKQIRECHASQLAKAEALLEEKVDLLVETEERCANTEADRDQVASKYAGLVEKHDTLLRELERFHAELENERSRVENKDQQLKDCKAELSATVEKLGNERSGAADREQMLKEHEAKLSAVSEKLQQMTDSYNEMCEKQKAIEKSAIDTEAQLLGKTYMLKETEERLAQLEAISQEVTKDLTERVKKRGAGITSHDELTMDLHAQPEKYGTLLKELEHFHAELEHERSRVVDREQALKEREAELLAVSEELQQITTSYNEMCEKLKAAEKLAIDTDAQLLSKSYLLKEAEERMAQLEAVSQEITKDLTERVKRRDAGITSHEELIMDLRAQLFAEQERVLETDKLLQESRTRLNELEQKYGLLKQQHETSVSTVDERINTQMTDMKRKCLVKVKSVRAEYEAKLSDSVTSLSTAKSAADVQVNELEKVVHEQEIEIQMLQTRLQASETELERQTSEIQLKLERSREQLAELESCIVDKENRQKEALEAQAEQLNREKEERVADLKRRAETRLGQIKRQLQTEKESAVNDLNCVADELRARLAACEDELHDALEQGQDAQNKDARISELAESLSEVRRVLQEHSDEMKEKESTIDSYQMELDSLEKKLQNSVGEIDVLTASLRDAEQSQTNLRQQLSATELERQKLAERCEVEVRTAALDSEQELERLKAEYDEKLRDTETEHGARIKQFVKEFRLQMAQKEKEFQTSYNEVLGM